MSDELFFDQFMASSALDAYSVKAFADRLSAYDSDQLVQRSLAFPLAATPLPSVSTRLDAIAKKRQSSREFGTGTVSAKDLSAVLQSLRAWHGLDHRAYGAAGSLYAVETFALTYGVKGMPPQMVYYDAATHGYVALGAAPDWSAVVETLSIEVRGVPQVLLLFAVYPERVTVKYGERGGRFALYEVGMALQQVSLAAAERGLKGVAVGGVFDEYWRNTLGLDRSAWVSMGYLLGR